MKTFNYFDGWKNAKLVCPKCHWEGCIETANGDDSLPEVVEFRCPTCSETLAIVCGPTLDELREHWDVLTIENKRFYARRMELDAEFGKHHLESPAQLPRIEDDPLILVWDIEFDSRGEFRGPTYTTIKHKGQVIWKERAYYECVGRFNEVVKVLRAKYGDKLAALIPTGRSRTYLYGDILSPSLRVLDIDSSYPVVGLEALAEAGDQDALNQFRYKREFAVHHLAHPDQLPDILGDSLVLTWDLAESPPRVSVQVSEYSRYFEWDEEAGDGFLYITLQHESLDLWREAASTETYSDDREFHSAFADRYSELAAIAKSKYGARLKDIVPSSRSGAYCGGMIEDTLRKVRKRCFQT